MKVSQLFEGINSLIGVNKLHDMTWKELTKNLEQEYGIKVIGTGSFATVFWHPSWNFVYKVFEEDSGYMRFVEYVMSNQYNPHLPKILRPPRQFHAFHLRAAQTTSKLWAVKMELLEEVSGEVKEFLTNGRMWYATRRYAGEQIDTGSIQYELDDFEKTLDELFMQFKEYDMEGLVETLADLADVCGIDPYDFDLHTHNFLMRNNTIVIIDPMVNDDDKPAYFRNAVNRFIMVKRGPDYRNTPEIFFTR